MPAPKGHPNYNVEGKTRPVIYTEEFINNEAIILNDWINKDEKNIFIQDFCLLRGYSYKRFHEWTKSNEKLADLYNIFLTKQQLALYKGGLTKKFNFPMCALILSHHHNIHQKTEQRIEADISTKTLLDEIADQTKDLIRE